MQSHRKGTLARSAVLGVAATVVLIAASGSQAYAARHDDYKGWFISLDAAMTQPNGLDQQYANIVEPPPSSRTTRMVMDNDADFTWAAKIGYSWGELGGLAVSYWSFDNEDTISATESVNYVYPTVFGAFGYNSYGTYALVPPVDYQATAKTKASTIDLDYTRPMHAGEKMTVNWIAGLRSATFEEDRSFDSGLDLGGYYVHQTHHVESDAIGVKVGANVKFGFGDHFALHALMSWSFMQANTEGKATQNKFGFAPDEISADDDHVMGEIRDYDLRGVWTWDAFDFYVGYGGQTWDGLVEDPINGSCCSPASGAGRSVRDSIAFNSAHAGVTFRFGGKR